MSRRMIIPDNTFGKAPPPNFRVVKRQNCDNCKHQCPQRNDENGSYNCAKYTVWVYHPTGYICDGWEEKK